MSQVQELQQQLDSKTQVKHQGNVIGYSNSGIAQWDRVKKLVAFLNLAQQHLDIGAQCILPLVCMRGHG